MTGRMTRYNSLKHEVESNRQFYDTMLQKVNEAGIASAVRQSNIRLVAPAEPPIHPSKPNLPLNLAIGLFAGLGLAVGTVMLSEQANWERYPMLNRWSLWYGKFWAPELDRWNELRGNNGSRNCRRPFAEQWLPSFRLSRVANAGTFWS
jgi:hypothetical protein